MRQSLEELDGVFTYMCVTKDALGVCKDEMAAKPLVLYEGDDMVALASEEIAIRAVLDREIETYDPYEGGGAGMDALSRRARASTTTRAGWSSPTTPCPTSPRSTATTAVFDAKDLTTRKINLELRDLIYERGITDVTVQNPGAKHSLGVGILTRCKITFEGSLGYFGCGLIDGPEIQITGRVGWSACENMMSGVVVIDGNAGSLTGAAIRGGDLVDQGPRSARARASTRRAG